MKAYFTGAQTRTGKWLGRTGYPVLLYAEQLHLTYVLNNGEDNKTSKVRYEQILQILRRKQAMHLQAGTQMKH